MSAIARLASQLLVLALSSAITAGPPDAGAAERETLVSRASVTIRADARGFYHVVAELNGAPVQAVVDTGATAIYLGRAQAAALGIDTTRGRRTEMSTFRGRRAIRVIKLERVQIGALVARDVDAWIAEEGDEGPTQPLLGMSLLQRFEVRIAGGVMSLTERAK